jgi:hypothetical protein
MRFPSSILLLIAMVVTGSARMAAADEYRVVPSDKVTACQAGTDADWVPLQGPRDVAVARADSDKLNVAVCAANDGAVNVRWRANGYWKASGNITDGCAEILGASRVKVRAVATNFHQTASYRACVQE